MPNKNSNIIIQDDALVAVKQTKVFDIILVGKNDVTSQLFGK